MPDHVSSLRASVAVRLLARIGLTAALSLSVGRAAVHAADDAPTAAAGAKRTYPSIPGAVREIPEWLAKDAPFDVAAHFKPIAAEENAALLYLDVLYEFSPDSMKVCVSPAEDAARGPALRERAARTAALQARDEPIVTAAERNVAVVEYHETFEKLLEAQKRPKCLFETGLNLGAFVEYAQDSRQIIRLLDWRVELWTAQGELDLALADVEMGLRFGRDLRPRGPGLAQLSSVVFDIITARELVPRILGARDITQEDCDRLLDILSRHEAAAVDFAEVFRVEYLMLRDLIHRLELKEDLGAAFGKEQSNGQLLSGIIGDEPVADPIVAHEIDELLARMTPADFAAEVEALNRWFRPLVSGELPPSTELAKVQERQERAVRDLKIVRYQLVWLPPFFEAIRRDRAQMGASKCLVALARWRLQHGDKLPPDLATVCTAARLKAVPIDPYSKTGEPVRWAIQGEEFVIYSVGPDGEDNGGPTVLDRDDPNGDWIFRLPPRAGD